MEFIPSLELSRMLYEEEIHPILEKKFPSLKVSVATLGMCSEVLGLDDAVSMDHEWGPRVTIFLSETDAPQYSDEIMQVIKESLPPRFHGYSMMWRKPGVDIHNTKKTVLYHVYPSTLRGTLKFYGGITTLRLKDVDWLRISEQHLLEFTSGVVYRDDTGDLTKARQILKYYPDNILRFLLQQDWNTIGSDLFPVGRIGSRGDLLGLHLQTAKIVHSMMRIAFRVSRRYFHYKKWFGTLFKQLPIASILEPLFLDLLAEQNWLLVEEKVCQAASILIQEQNLLGISEKINFQVKTVDDGRHHLKVDFWDIGRKTAVKISPQLKTLLDNQVFLFDERSLILWNEEIGKWPLLLQKEA